MFPRKIKCVIWDLDDTVWKGSLAEKDIITLRQPIVDLITLLNQKGIINSICSKNNYDEARNILQEAGIWELMVFSVIDFVPKGQSVKAIIENLQLRPDNVLFVDDNIINRNEVQYYCSNIMVADANEDKFVTELIEIIKETSGSSRLEQYRILEKKHQEKQRYAENNEFLKDSDIKVCVLRNPTDLTFKKRIFDLANRTNQLNFTNSRFATYEGFEEYLEAQDSMYIHHAAIFVYDRYGDYGLVGFYAFDERREKRRLDHFFFSCRILNMGIEEAVYKYLRKNIGLKPFTVMEARTEGDTSFIKIIHDVDERLDNYIKNEMDLPEQYKTVVSAGCASGIIGHYLPDSMKPASFELISISETNGTVPSVENMIYAIYADYINTPWKGSGGFSYLRFRDNLEKLLEKHNGKKMFLLLSSEKYRSLFPRDGAVWYKKIRMLIAAYIYGSNNVRFIRCNSIVREVSLTWQNVTVIEAGDFIHFDTEQYDARHFERVVFKRICEFIASSMERSFATL